jgi:hypothetical protein
MPCRFAGEAVVRQGPSQTAESKGYSRELMIKLKVLTRLTADPPQSYSAAMSRTHNGSTDGSIMKTATALREERESSRCCG